MLGSGEGTEVPDSLINSFALVSYLPEPLAGFVDTLRREAHTDQDVEVRGHVTILPPRPLACLADNAAADLEHVVVQLQPFYVELQEVLVFPRSDVLYLSIGEGAEGLKQLHEKFSIGRLRFLEYFDYHPHVTLAQFLPKDRVTQAAEQAAQKWKTYTGPRRFLLDRVTLVQNTRHNHWRNLQEFLLGAHVPV